MQANLRIDRLKMRLSPARLNSYGDLTKDPLDEVLARYMWNCALSESLYQSLHWLEISLRNNIYEAGKSVWGTSWLTNGGQLLRPEEELVLDVINRLSKDGKSTTPQDIVAALSFGFWTSLFRAEYEIKFRSILPRVFPFAGSDRKRHIISGKLNHIRNFRNRIFHFETIINYKPDVRYGEMRQVIEWMAPEILPFLDVTCEFKVEFAKGYGHYLKDCNQIISTQFY